MVLAWMRGPTGSVVDYWHCEGVCNSSDTVRGVPNAHSMCKADMDYTLRVAFYVKQNLGHPLPINIDEVPDWCVVCRGTNATCKYCRCDVSVRVGTFQGSQREEAAEFLLLEWPAAPLDIRPKTRGGK